MLATRNSLLDRLVAPLSARSFLDDYWERRSLVLSGDPSRFQHLFALGDVGRLLHYLKPSPPEGMMLVRESQHYARRWTNADGTPRPSSVRAALGEGYSLIVNGIDKLWEPVERFAGELQAQLQHPVDVNLYVTPPGARAFSHHWDIMDVFILQVAGSKTWQIREAAVDRPLPDEHAPVGDPPPPLVFEGDLDAGGLLYIPRGHVHSACTTRSLSMHLSVGVHPKTWLDLLSAAIKASRGDSRLRGALPPGYLDGSGVQSGFKELAAALPALLDPDRALGQLAQDWLVSQSPPPGDAFLDAAPDLAADSVVRLRADMLCHVFEGEGRAGMSYSGGQIAGPAKIGAALRTLSQRGAVAIRDLDPRLSEREALVLATRLYRDGLLVLECQHS
ncbi:MAG: cupin domain-containing protein [Sphingomonas sp.]